LETTERLIVRQVIQTLLPQYRSRFAVQDDLLIISEITGLKVYSLPDTKLLDQVPVPFLRIYRKFTNKNANDMIAQ
jgi:hypothetical protein